MNLTRIPIPDKPGMFRRATEEEMLASLVTVQGEQTAAVARGRCIHRGAPVGEKIACSTCPNSAQIQPYACAIHDRCTPETPIDAMACCATCPDHKRPRTIAVECSANGIGDALLGLTVVAGLKRADPEAHVAYVLRGEKLAGAPWVAPWVALFGGYDELRIDPVEADLTFHPHDSYGLQMAERTRKPRWEYYAGACGDVQPVLPMLRPLPPDAVAWADNYRDAVLLAPWSGFAREGAPAWAPNNRVWLLSHWLALERLLHERGLRTVILDNVKGRNDAFSGARLIGESPARVAALMGAARCVVGNDSGMVHLAGMLGTPAVALCAQIPGEQIYGLYPSVRVLQGPLPCSGCHWTGLEWRAACDTLCASLQSIQPADVLALLPVFHPEQLAGLFAERDRVECRAWLPRYAKLWEVVRRFAPRRIVEIGVRAGYSAWTMLDACPAATLIGIDADIDPADGDSHGGYAGAWHHAKAILPADRFVLRLADSHTLEWLPECDVCYIDGNHTEEGCHADLLLAERSGALVILLDDYATPDLGVRAAVDRFMGERPDLAGTFHDNGSTGLYAIDRR